MSAGTRAKQIADLADQIPPLGKKARGMPLTADDWNELISIMSALLKIDQDQDEDMGGRLAQSYARADHAHQGQVSIDWLDAELQTRLSDGGGDPISTRQVVATMQKTVDDLRGQVASFRAQLETLQARLDDSSSAEIDRSRKLAAFDTRFTGIEDLRTSVSGIAKSQTSLAKNVKAVLDLRGQLTDATGAPIDVSALQKNVAELDSLRDSLTGVDGQPLRLRDLQLQVIEVADQLPGLAGGAGGAALDTRFADLEASLTTRFTDDSATRIEALKTELTAADSALSDRLQVQMEDLVKTGREGTLEAATELINASEARLGASLSGQIETTRTTLAASVREQADLAVAQGLSTLDTRIVSAVDSRTADLQLELASGIKNAVDTAVTKQVGDLSRTVDGRLTTVEANVAGLADTIPAEVKRSVDAASGELKTQFDARLDARSSALEQLLGETIDQRVKSGIDAGIVDIRGVATQTVNDRLGNLDSLIAVSVDNAMRGVPEQIDAAVSTKLNQANIPGQIATANATLSTQLRSEIAASAASVQSNNTVALNSAVSNLRTEFVASPSRAAGTATGPVIGAGVRLRPG